MELPRCQEPLDPASKFGVTPKRPRLGNLRREDDLALSVEEGEDPFDIRSVPGFNQSGHNLDVLLRHRPSSISGCGWPTLALRRVPRLARLRSRSVLALGGHEADAVALVLEDAVALPAAVLALGSGG